MSENGSSIEIPGVGVMDMPAPGTGDFPNLYMTREELVLKVAILEDVVRQLTARLEALENGK